MKPDNGHDQPTLVSAIGGSLFILLAFFLGQGLVAQLYPVFSPDLIDAGDVVKAGTSDQFNHNSLFLALSIIFGGSIGLFTLFCVSHYQKINLISYFRLSHSCLLILTGWIAAAIILSIAVWYLFRVLDWQSESPIMQALSTDSFSWPIAIAVIFIAPLFEECLFRGYLYKTLEIAGLKLLWVVALPNSIWTLLHIGQYTLLALLVVFLVGLFFGYARWKSNSLLIPITMHIAFNLTTVLLV